MAIAVLDEKRDQPTANPNGAQAGGVVADGSSSEKSGDEVEKKPVEGLPVSRECILCLVHRIHVVRWDNGR